MQDNIRIDGQLIYETWGITPLSEKFYASLMQYPDAKDKVVSSYLDEDGIHVLSQPTYIKSKEMTLDFGAKDYASYLSFMNYLVAHPNFVLLSYKIDRQISLEYISKSDFHYYPNTKDASFAIKVREANFKNRTNIYLLTENSDKIMIENGKYIII